MRQGLHWHRRRAVSRRVWVLALVLALVALAVPIMLRIHTTVIAFAEMRAQRIAEMQANDTVAAVLESHTQLCRDMVKVTYNDQRMLTSVMADAASVNTIKTAVASSLTEHFGQMSTLSADIPLGTLLGPEWLSGMGPLVRFPISVSASVMTTVSSSLEAVGMNQSAYKVLLNVHIVMGIIVPDGRTSVVVDSSFPMAEAVLLGDVPDTLTEVYGDDQTLLGKIFDYGTTE